MVDYEFADLYTKPFINKQIQIAAEDGSVTITDSDFHLGSLELQETICSEQQLVFGSCETSSIAFTISNTFISLKDKWLTVKQILEGGESAPFQFGRYKVFSDVPTADKNHREIKAYDAMYDILSADVADWYVSVLPDMQTTLTLKQFRDLFFQHFGIQQKEITLANDEMIVEKTIDPSELSGKDVIEAICEINGCFGHIGRDGKFNYVHLEKNIQGLYPSNDLYPSDTLYPIEPKTTSVGGGTYINCDYEDFITDGITKLQVRQKENDIGAVIGTGSNCYVVEDNFLVYGKSASDLETIARTLYGVISGITYRPVKTLEAVGNPCLEVGDPIRTVTRYELIETYILERTLKGSQSLRDTYVSKGKKVYGNDSNTVNKSIVQLRGKTNELTRTVEETNSRITDVQAGLQSEIQQTAESITSTVSAATSKYDTTKDGTTYNISLYGYSAPANSVYPPHTYNGQYYLNNSNGYVYQSDGVNWRKVAELTLITEELNTKIEETASGININIRDNYLSKSDAENTYETQTGASDKLNSAKGYADNAAGEVRRDLTNTIELTAQGLAASITAETQRASGAETTLSNNITATAEGLSIEIARATTAEEASAMVSRINQTAEQISIDANKLNLSSNGWKILSNGDFELGGVGTNAALSYDHTTNYIAMRDGLSLVLNGISIVGDRYRFDNNGAYKYNENTGSWDDISISSDALSQITFDATGSYYVYVTQFPNMTIVEAKFSITAAGTGTILLSHILPPHILPISSVTNRVPITFHNANNWQTASGLNYGNVTQVYSNITGGVRLRASNIETLGTLSGSSSGKQYITDTIVYPSYSYPLDQLLESGYIDIAI